MRILGHQISIKFFVQFNALNKNENRGKDRNGIKIYLALINWKKVDRGLYNPHLESALKMATFLSKW